MCDEEEYRNYERHGPDNWKIEMGMSMECVWDYKELEKAFQEFLNNF